MVALKCFLRSQLDIGQLDTHAKGTFEIGSERSSDRPGTPIWGESQGAGSASRRRQGSGVWLGLGFCLPMGGGRGVRRTAGGAGPVGLWASRAQGGTGGRG